MRESTLDYDPDEQPRRPRRNSCLLVGLILGGVVVVGVVALVLGLAYLGSVGPEISVYSGSQVPSRYLETMREVGALEPEEQLLYFYSDGLADIHDGFYFVSDRKVGVYSQDLEEPLFTAAFSEIADAELLRDTSFFTDSQITLTLRDGESIWFPVSSEFDRDVNFHEAIVERLDR